MEVQRYLTCSSLKLSYHACKRVVIVHPIRLTLFMSRGQQNINKKTPHFCHANLEFIFYKTVA